MCENKNFNKVLLMNVESFVDSMEMTSLIKEELLAKLIKYEYCRENNLNSFDYNTKDLKDNEFNSHLVGFIDGDGYIKTGKRVGHKKGYYRIVPHITIELSNKNERYLNLIIKKIFLENKKVHNRIDRSIAVIDIRSKEELNKIMGIIDGNNGFISEKKSKDYIKFKELLNYLDITKEELHGEAWVNKGMEIWSENIILEDRETREKGLNYINKNLTINYLLGFIEAKGLLKLQKQNANKYMNSFELKSTDNDLILDGILEFIKNYKDPLYIVKDIDLGDQKVSLKKSKKNVWSSLLIDNEDILYYKIIPMLLSTNMYTKMELNLVNFILGVVICKYLKDIPECKKLYIKIKDSITNNELLNLNEVLLVLNKYLKK